MAETDGGRRLTVGADAATRAISAMRVKFLKHWDTARVAMLHPWQKDGWAKDFLDIVKDLIAKLREDEDALATWMRQERRRYLHTPALIV